MWLNLFCCHNLRNISEVGKDWWVIGYEVGEILGPGRRGFGDEVGGVSVSSRCSRGVYGKIVNIVGCSLGCRGGYLPFHPHFNDEQYYTISYS